MSPLASLQRLAANWARAHQQGLDLALLAARRCVMSIHALSLFVSSSKAHNWLSVVSYPVLFLALQILNDVGLSTDASLPFSPLDLAVIEALKLAFNVLVRFRSGEVEGPFRKTTQGRHILWDASRDVDFEEQPLRGLDGAQDAEGSAVPARGGGVAQEPPPDAALARRSWLTVAFASGVWAGTTYVFSSALNFFDPPTVQFTSATSTVLVVYSLYAFSGRGITAALSQNIALQLFGILLAKIALTYPSEPPSFILLAVAFTSACNVLIIDNIYRSHPTALHNRLNAVLFTSGLAFHTAICAFQAISFPPVFMSDWSLHRISSIIIRARLDWIILSILRDHDPILERVLYSLSLALLLLTTSLHNKLLSLTLLVGSIVAIWSSISHVLKELHRSHHSYETAEHGYSLPTHRRRFIAWTIFAILSLGSILGATEAIFRSGKSVAAQDALLPPISSSSSSAVCQRRPLRFSPPHDAGSRRYKHFDDVLLIIFFSHPRYDTNLEFYREAYAEYFPNMVFIGPASREDSGFNHSYDVLVDTYQAAEDLRDPEEYKMGGRMAHHMLYTALQEHPCYEGYLWAPFDTLLNVPRLQLFDQNKFWYHSPFGLYVPNRALPHSAIGNASFHAPPASISPDPANMTTPWKGWGEDWWWGSPYVGLPVCMPAFLKVPEAQRERLAALTGERDRLIGGSADTMYIPGRHRATFMSVLGTFLQTNCFLEIAAPTALHLALPPDEHILFVDHWWIWQPPFDTDFVRGQWAQGREVDSFHAFHWGEQSGEGDAWEPRPERIRDLRRLFRDSARRQGISFP